MAEEKTSYLEPIEDAIVQEKSALEKEQESKIEKPSTSEAQVEKKPEVKSENETIYQKILSSVSATSSLGDVDVNADADKVSLQTDADSTVRQLVDLAMTKGVVHAVKVARRLNDFYVLDQVHDDLANRLYDSLKQKGLIEE
jgi:hypothetical protein